MQNVTCIVFGFNGPDKLFQVFNALKDQGIPELYVNFDGSRNEEDRLAISKGINFAENIRWTKTQILHTIFEIQPLR